MQRYRERLWAPWWAWPVVGIGPLMLGVAYGHAISAAVGWVLGVALAVLAGTALLVTSPVIEVTDHGIRAGRAFLEAEFLGPVTALDNSQARRLRGVDADGRAYVVLRGWLPTAVRLVVADDRDPAPYWYVSTSDPAALAAALNQARRASSTPNVEGSTTGVVEDD
jgi:hypothetical protein